MFHIKRLYTFILQSFLPLFLMTFGICLFIVLMQFLWRYVEELVGKGLDNSVLAELFLYAALNLIPMALPLAILLASLMTFGNMGERLELLAIKASGVSLLKAMRPLLIVIAGIAIGAFFFQNNAMPKISVKFFALLSSIKQKSPELNIPEESFYSDIDNFSIYVKKKDPETRMLHGVMIYDIKNFNNISVIVCDSAKMTGSESKDFLLLNMYNGQQFGNLREAQFGNITPSYSNSQFIPYSRENFQSKDIIIKFNSGFSRMDESAYEGTQIALNMRQLSHAVDSMQTNLDSLNLIDKRSVLRIYDYDTKTDSRQLSANNLSDTTTVNEFRKKITLPSINFDSLVNSLDRSKLITTLERATSRSEDARNTFSMQSWTKTNLQSKVRRHQVELHRKFTLSFACIVFFFIGAPLGAIIRKGGMGVPVIISVIFFIIYYVLNNVGEKMARDGIWEMWQGMWFSSLVLFPIGVFLTYKSMNDSDLFNIEAYAKYIRKALIIKTSVNQDKLESYNNSNIPEMSELDADKEFIDNLNAMPSDKLKDILYNFCDYGYNRSTLVIVLSILKSRNEIPQDITIKRINNQQVKSISKQIYTNSLFALISYSIGLFGFITAKITDISSLKLMSMAFITIYLGLYLRSFLEFNDLYKSIQEKIIQKQNLIRFIGLIFYPILYFYEKVKIKKVIKNLKKY